MLPFSKRPPPPDEYLLRSGDFEAVHGHTHPQVPGAAHAPVFARQATPAPYGFSQNHQGYAQPQHNAHLDLTAPPHSLAPVAMGSDRSHAGSVGSTNAHLAQTVVIREKPSIKWGVMIALTGALLGGVLGLGLDAHRQAQRAAAAAGDRESALSMSATLPTQAAVNGLAAAPAIPVATTLASNGVVTPAAPLPLASPLPIAIAARAPVVLPPSQPVAVTKAEPPAKPEKHAAARPAPARHQGFVAAKVSAPKAAPEKVEVPTKPEAKPEAKPEPTKSAKAEKGGAPAAPGDARKVLEDAIKDTTNTL